MYNDLPDRVVAVVESHVLVGDAIAALDVFEGDSELQVILDALRGVYDNQAAFLDSWGSPSGTAPMGASVPA